eukprot:TRINITY_DN6562_c0_g1_i2.p1 TRINITY_DN6562_c0_g1~~TRINITY_DN6562_c0_g1_i2.p1  ORF type:complete len:895 (-),score=176.32 TRINITY_DN6562_c0_g1_i2:48-2732(-)
MQLLIERKELFTEIDRKLCDKPILEHWQDPCLTLPQFTSAEQESMATVLAPHQRAVDSSWSYIKYFNVTIENTKTHTSEPRILILDYNRMYIFHKGGRLEYTWNYLEIESVVSFTRYSISISYKGAGPKAMVTIFPISFGSFDMDQILEWFYRQWVMNFIGFPGKRKFEIAIHSKERLESILNRIAIPETALVEDCSGLVRTYWLMCDYLNVPVSEELIWHFEEYFYGNGIKVLNLDEVIGQDKYPNNEFHSLMLALKHNLWFDTLLSIDLPLGNEGVNLLASVFKHNKIIHTLTLTNSGAKAGLITLFESFLKNQQLAIQRLNLAKDLLDIRATGLLCDCLRTTLSRLSSLNVSNTGLQKKTMQMFLEALSNTTSLLKSLKDLDISNNKLDSDTSRLLGVMLAKGDCILSSLHMSDTTPVFYRIIDGMTDGKEIKQCPSLKFLDISGLKLKSFSEVISFLTGHVPNLTELNLSSTDIPESCLLQVTESLEKLTSLDLSDNELSLHSVCQALAGKKVKTLKINRAVLPFKKNNETTLAIEGLTSLSIEGGGKFTLKSDLPPLVLSLVGHPTLTELNVSNQQAGDALATAIGKLLQYNTALTSLNLSNNDLSLKGLKTIKHSLLRNTTLQYLFLPLPELAGMLVQESTRNVENVFTRQDTVDIREVLAVLSDIQSTVYKNASRPPTQSLQHIRSLSHVSVNPNENRTTRANIQKYVRTSQPPLDIARISMVFGSGNLEGLDEDELDEDELSIDSVDSANSGNHTPYSTPPTTPLRQGSSTDLMGSPSPRTKTNISINVSKVTRPKARSITDSSPRVDIPTPSPGRMESRVSTLSSDKHGEPQVSPRLVISGSDQLAERHGRGRTARSVGNQEMAAKRGVAVQTSHTDLRSSKDEK